MSTRGFVPGRNPVPLLWDATLQNRGWKFDAFPDGLCIYFGAILAAQMAPKSRPRGGPDTLSNVYQSQIEKKKVLASFVLALSTLRRCNLPVKTQVFLKIFTSSLLSLLLIILAHEGLKKQLKIGVQDVPKPFQNALRSQVRVSSVSGTGLEGFWTPKWLPKRGL